MHKRFWGTNAVIGILFCRLDFLLISLVRKDPITIALSQPSVNDKASAARVLLAMLLIFDDDHDIEQRLSPSPGRKIIPAPVLDVLSGILAFEPSLYNIIVKFSRHPS